MTFSFFQLLLKGKTSARRRMDSSRTKISATTSTSAWTEKLTSSSAPMDWLSQGAEEDWSTTATTLTELDARTKPLGRRWAVSNSTPQYIYLSPTFFNIALRYRPTQMNDTGERKLAIWYGLIRHWLIPVSNLGRYCCGSWV